VVPCFNEAAVLGQTLADLAAVFPNIVCVDDASTDSSATIAQTNQSVRLVRHPVNLGQGGALQTGFAYALADPAMQRVVTFDADGQHRVADALMMVRRLGEPNSQGQALQAVLGSRGLLKSRQAHMVSSTNQIGWCRRSLLRLATRYTRLTTGLKVTDTHNGLRALSRPVVQTIELRHGGMAHASELLEQLAKGHFAWAEHLVQVDYSAYSRAKGQPTLNAVNIATELLLRNRQ
jgi:glycosyltransferase involved in cell wall biosynthesis